MLKEICMPQRMFLKQTDMKEIWSLQIMGGILCHQVKPLMPSIVETLTRTPRKSQTSQAIA